MIAIIDYGAGNLFSVKNALDYIGVESVVTKDADTLEKADRLILPGVGAFPDAMKMLSATGLIPAIKEQVTKKPLLGICLGMQLLFEKSFEFEECEGLGLVKGYVDRIPEDDLIIPHMGWNKLEYTQSCPLFEGLGDNEYVYFVHSYKAFCPDEALYAYSEYGSRVAAVAGDGKHVFGCQFHPEKSGKTGLRILENFVRMCGEVR